MANLLKRTAQSWVELTTLEAALQSLATGSTATSEAIDNSGGLYPELELSLILASFTPSATFPYLEVHVLPITEDGTNYADVTPSTYKTTLQMATGASAKYLTTARLAVPASNFKIAIVNQSGATLAASGHGAKYSLSTLNLNG